MTAAPERVRSLTSIRGLLALWVVLHHYADDLLRLVPALDPLAFLLHRGGFAVPGFFMLSGFVLAHTYAARPDLATRRGALRFWFARLARIYPVHFVTLLAVLALVLAANRLGRPPNDPSGYSARDFALNLLLVQTWVPDFTLNWNYPAWSIASEWFAYLLFPFVAVRLRPPARRRRAIAATTLAVAASAAVYSTPPFPFRELLCVVPTFAAGLGIYALTHCRPVPRARIVRWAPELALLGIALGCALDSAVSGAVITSALFALILGSVLLRNEVHPWWLARAPIALGEVSYSLYMTHAVAQKVLHKLLPTSAYEGADPGTRAAVIAAYCALIVASCAASYYLVEKPCRAWAKRRLAARFPSRTPSDAM